MTDDAAHRAIAEGIGEALIEWSRVEHLWANIFRDLLFLGIGDRPSRDPDTRQILAPQDGEEKNNRADALFFAHKNSQQQLKLLAAVGRVALEKHQDLLEDFTSLLKLSEQLSQRRNSIAHAYYDNRLVIKDGQIEITPTQALAFGRFKKAPDMDLANDAHAFAELSDKVFAFWDQLNYLQWKPRS